MLQLWRSKNNQKKNVEELCKTLPIPHIFVDASQEFYDTVIDYFVTEFLNARTPFPCAVCNPKLKWNIVFKKAQEIGCDFIASGHYVGIEETNGIHYITQGLDPDKDQSFFLWGLNQEILQKTIFPLGKLKKTDVRKYADEQGFQSIATRKDSLGICFLGNTDYRPFITQELQKRGIQIPQGKYRNEQGEFIAKNEGYLWYTVGQRRQLGVHLNSRVFVKSIHAAENSVVLSNYTALFKTQFCVENYYFHTLEDTKKTLIVKIRYRKQANLCTLEIINETQLIVHLSKPLESIAPGQTAVFYDEGRVVGGGFIG